MKIIKNILLGFGLFLVLAVAFVTYLGFQSAGFKKEYSPFITKFMNEFSQNWEIADVRDMLTNDFIKQLETPNSRQAMLYFRQLGKMTNIQDIELKNYRTRAGTDSYKFGEFVFKADFEHASGLVTMSVIVKKDGERIQGLHINPTTEINKTPSKITI